MIRLLMFFLWIVFFAGGLTLLISAGSLITVEAFGARFDIQAGVGAALALALAALIAGATSTVKDVVGAPRIARARRESARRERGLAAITKGLEAIAAGDAAQARRQAEIATRSLGAAPVARLLTAQAAQLAGDDLAANAALAGMLEAPETEFLALRGLYAKAARDGDREKARAYAARAFALHAKAGWAFEAAFEFALEANDFAAAQEAVTRAASAKTIDRQTADRGLAAVLTASAFASIAAGDEAAALDGAASALKHDRAFAPAATLAASLLAKKAETRKAGSILLAAFEAAPERAIAEAFEELHSDESPANLAEQLERLASKNPETREAGLVRARACLARGDADAAAALLEQGLKSSATARALRMMASAEEARSGAAAAGAWLARAAAAPRDPSFGADEFRRITGEGWRRLIREYMDHGRLAPPPLEAPPPGLTDADFSPVAAPALEAPAEEAPHPDETDANTDTEELETREAAAARTVS